MNFDFADKNDSKDVPENDIPENFGQSENPNDAEASQQNNFSEMDRQGNNTPENEDAVQEPSSEVEPFSFFEPNSADNPEGAPSEELPSLNFNSEEDFLDADASTQQEDDSNDFDDAFGEVEDNVEGGAVIGSPELKNLNFDEEPEEEEIPPIEPPVESDEQQKQSWLPDSTSEEDAESEEEESNSDETSEEQTSQTEENPEDSFGFGEAPQEEPEEIKALDKKVRTPDGEQEYLLSELIDVETGLPLDLASLIPAELIAGIQEGGFGFGGEEGGEGGFDMTSGGEEGAAKRKRRPAPKPKAAKGGIGGIILGGALAVMIFPYVMGVIEMTTGKTSNIPIPAPGIKCTYKYIPKWWPEWAMFVFPGRDTASADKPADSVPPAPAPENKDGENAPEGVQPDDSVSEQLQQEGGENLPGESGEETPAEPEPAENSALDSVLDSALDEVVGNADSTEQPAEEAPAEPVKPGLVSAPTYTPVDVTDAFAAVGIAIKAANKTIDKSAYTAICNMAEKSTFVDTSKKSPELVESMKKVQKLMTSFSAKPAFVTALSDNMETRSADAADQAGVLIVGTLSGVSERDGYNVGLMDVEGKPGLTLEIVGLRKIKPAVGTKIVVCGKRIANPDTNLAGFSDNGMPVVWGGIILPAESK